MKKLVVLSGAGMSAESGISTFRDMGGLWEQYRIEEVATPEAWEENPELVLEFYNQRREQLVQAKPNAGHLALAELEKKYDVQIITQNVDNLHERAGSTHVLHLHGELMKVRSTGFGQEVYELTPDNYKTHLGDKCPKGFQLRPHIVWFGESVPNYSRAVEIAQQADIMLVIGTSLQVYPAAGLVNYSPEGIPVYLIDPNDIPNLPSYITVIRKGAGEGMKEILKLLMG
ncbi:MAG: NAD-dependent deacylase [Paludibacter sp.]